MTLFRGLDQLVHYAGLLCVLLAPSIFEACSEGAIVIGIDFNDSRAIWRWTLGASLDMHVDCAPQHIQSPNARWEFFFVSLCIRFSSWLDVHLRISISRAAPSLNNYLMRRSLETFRPATERCVAGKERIANAVSDVRIFIGWVDDCDSCSCQIPLSLWYPSSGCDREGGWTCWSALGAIRPGGTSRIGAVYAMAKSPESSAGRYLKLRLFVGFLRHFGQRWECVAGK